MGYFNSFAKINYRLTKTQTKRVTNLAKYTAVFSEIADNASFYSFYTMNGSQRLDNISTELYGNDKYYWTIPLLNGRIRNTWKDLPNQSQSFEIYLRKKYPGFALTASNLTPISLNFTLNELIGFDRKNTFTVAAKYPSLNYVQAIPSDEEIEDFSDLQLNIWDNVTQLNNNPAVARSIISNDLVEFVGGVEFFEAVAYYVDENDNIVSYLDFQNNPENITPVTWREIEFNQNDVKSRIKVIRPAFIKQVVKEFEQQMRISS